MRGRREKARHRAGSGGNTGGMKSFLLSIFLLLFPVNAALRAADLLDLTGIYRCKGPTYDGTVTISHQGDAYRVNWTIGTRERYSGLGLVQGDVLAVAYYGRVQGLVVYRLEVDGQLIGRWTTTGKPGVVEIETLTRLTN